MTTATKTMPKKGDTIFTTGVWCDGGGPLAAAGFVNTVAAVYTRKLIVKSWGKKQATFVDAATGEFIKHFGYPESFVWAWTMEELAPAVVAVKIELKQRHYGAIDCMDRWHAEYGGQARGDVLVKHYAARKHMEEMILTEARVDDRETLSAELMTELKAERQPAR